MNIGIRHPETWKLTFAQLSGMPQFWERFYETRACEHRGVPPLYSAFRKAAKNMIDAPSFFK